MAVALNSWIYDGFDQKSYFNLDSGEIIYSSDDPDSRITVVKTPDIGNVLLLDGIVSLADKDDFVFTEMFAHVPLFSHPSPKSVLIVGGADGGVAREVLRHPTVYRVVTVEQDPNLFNVCMKYFPNQSFALDDFRVNIEIMNPDSFFDSCDEKFDVILIDPKYRKDIVKCFSSGRFLGQASELLSNDGIMVFTLPSPFEMPERAAELVGSFCSSFDNTGIYSAPCGIIEGKQYSFGFISAKHSPENNTIGDKIDSSGLITSFYNKERHRSSFSIPEPVKNRFQGMIDPV